MKYFRVFILFTFLSLFLCTTCDHKLGFSREIIDPVFTVTVAPTTNGTVRVITDSGKAGTQIVLAVNPAPGYRLRQGSLKRAIGAQPPMDDDNLQNPPYSFPLDNNSVIYAIFDRILANNYSVSIEEGIPGGTLIAYGVQDTEQGVLLTTPDGTANIDPTKNKKISVKIYPDTDFYLKEGSLSYTHLDSQNIPIAATTTVLSPPYEFYKPAANIIIRGEFETGDVSARIENGKRALLRDDYDAAVSAFESAFTLAPDNQEAIFYSTLGQLASIAVKPKVRQLIRSIGFGSYPGSLNNLLGIGDSWDNFEKEPGSGNYSQIPIWLYEFSGVLLPRWSNPGGYYAFQNQEAITLESKDRYGRDTMATWFMMMFSNIMGTNIENLNYVVEDALEYLLGSDFEEVSQRAARLNYGDTIVLEQGIIEKLFLDDFLKDGDHVGRAELDLIIASCRVFKSVLEWVSSYNLEFDRFLFRMYTYIGGGSFLPVWHDLYDELNRPYVDPSDLHNSTRDVNELVNTIVGFFLTSVDDYMAEDPGSASRIPDMFPLRNHFLMEQSDASSKMSRARRELIKAIDLITAAYDYYFLPGSEIPEIVQNNILPDFGWIQDSLSQLKNVIQNGGGFYFPGEMPTGSTWDFTAANNNNKYGIDLEKFFTPGQFNLDKIIESEPGGRRPKFYGWMDNTSNTTGTYITGIENFPKYDWIGFQLDLRSIKQVIVKGLEKDGRPLADIENAQAIIPYFLLTRNNGEHLYKFYHDLYNFTIK